MVTSLKEIGSEKRQIILNLILLFEKYKRDFDNDIEINKSTIQIFTRLVNHKEYYQLEAIEKIIDYKRENIILPLLVHIEKFMKDLQSVIKTYILPIRQAFKKRQIADLNYNNALQEVGAMKGSQYIEELPEYFHIGLNVLEALLQILQKENRSK